MLLWQWYRIYDESCKVEKHNKDIILVIIVKAGCLNPETFLKNREARHVYMSTRHYHQQQLVHQHVSLLQNNYTLNVTLKIKAEEEVSSRCIVESNLDNISGRKTRISDIHFLLCQSCFWCASYTSPFFTKGWLKKSLQSAPLVMKKI